MIHVLPERALDLCVDQQHVVVVTASNTGSAWTVMRHSDAGWSTTGTVETKDDNFVAASCTPGSITILTTTRLVTFDGKDQHTIPLAGTLTGGQIGAIYSSPDEFVVGFNNGEFGGGLRRIDRRSGSITPVKDSLGDSINSIIADPWKPGCIVVASGLVHMAPYGRIVEVCGTRVQHLYSRPNGIVYTIGDDSSPSDPFYWLSSDGKNLWAVGEDGYYSIDSQGNAQVLKHPPLKDVKGIAVSFDLPHFVVVRMYISRPDDMGVTILQIVPR